MKRGDNWPWRFHQIATDAAYWWTPPHLAVILRGSVERHGIEKVERAFRWWVRNVSRIERHSKWINPKSFAAKVGYWIHMSERLSDPWQP